MFSLCSNLLTKQASRGQFLQITGKNSRFKSIEQGHTEGTFSLPCKIPTLCLVGASPKPQKQEQMALALVSFQKQKLTVIKIFMKLDIEKAVFSEGQ